MVPHVSGRNGKNVTSPESPASPSVLNRPRVESSGAWAVADPSPSSFRRFRGGATTVNGTPETKKQIRFDQTCFDFKVLLNFWWDVIWPKVFFAIHKKRT